MPVVPRVLDRIQDQSDFAGALTDGAYLTYSSGTNKFSLAAVTVPTGANPSSSVGLSAVNGSASTFLRSDGAPALSQSIVPTWTGLHTFQAQTSAKAAVFKAAATTPGNIAEWQTSAGVVLITFTSDGKYLVGTNAASVASSYGFSNVVTRDVSKTVATAYDILFVGTNETGPNNPLGMTFKTYGGSVKQAMIISTEAGVSNNDLILNPSYGRIGIGTVPGTAVPAAMHIISNDANKNILLLESATSQAEVVLRLRGQSSTSTREQVDIDTAWATSTDASRKARGLFRVWDTAAREAIRIEADGSQAMLGFFGHAAVAQAVLATGAGATSDNIISALQALGLVKQS